MTWREEFHHALIWEIVRSGTPVHPDADRLSPFSWMADDWQDQKRAVLDGDVDYEKTMYEKSSWDEFVDTFYEGDTRKYGVDLHIVMTDGTKYHWRYTGTVSDLILALTKD